MAPRAALNLDSGWEDVQPDQPATQASGDWEDVSAQPTPAQPSALGSAARETALTVLEPFYYKNLAASAKAIPSGLKKVATAPFAPSLPVGIEQAASGITEAGGGVLGLAAPVFAAVPGLAPATLATAAALGPVSKGLGYVGEKLKQGIEYVSPESKKYPELTGLAANAATLAAGGKALESVLPAKAVEPAPEYPNPRGVTPESLYTRRTPQGQVYNDLPAIGEETVQQVLRRQPEIPGKQPVLAQGPAASPWVDIPSESQVETQPSPVQAPKQPLPNGPQGDFNALLNEVVGQRRGAVEENAAKLAEAQKAQGATEQEIQATRQQLAQVQERRGLADRRVAQSQQDLGAAERRIGEQRRQPAEIVPRSTSPEQVITEAGGEFKGIQPGIADIPDHALFNDPQTGTTLALPVDQVTSEAVKVRMEESRAKFAEPAAKVTPASESGKSLFPQSEQAVQQHLVDPGKAASPTLYFMGLDPGAIKSSINALGDLAKGEGPENLSTGTQARGIIRQETGGFARTKEQLFNDLQPLATAADRATPTQNLDFIDRMEAGKPQSSLADSQVAAMLRKLLDNRREAVQNLGTGKLQNFIENYFPHVWEDPTKASDVFRNVLGSKRPLQGPASFLKQRTIPTTAEGIAAGLNPVSYNPVTLTLLKVAEMDRYIMAHKILNGFKDEGLAKFVRLGQKAPDGWAPLDDRMFQVVHPSEEAGGMVIRGRYYAPADAAQSMDRYTSPGLMGSPTYRGLRAYGNLMNQAQLGASAFHAAFTSMDAMTSDVSLAVQRLSRGELGGAAVPALRAATLASPITNYLKGNQLLKEYLKPGSYKNLSKIANAVAQAGGRAFMDPFYKNSSIQAFHRAWKGATDAAKAGEVGKTISEGARAVRRSFGAAAELLAKPIMQNIVPRQKLGVFANLAEDVLRRNVDAPPEQLRYELNRAWDSVDNRMGQLVYDNLFWNKTVKDLGLISVRSLGWNLGTARELGGAVVDVGKQAGRLMAGKRPEITSRIGYAIALPMVTAYIGAITTYLATGKGPQNLIDYFYPPNGGIQPDGKPSRWSLPSYVRDVYGFSKQPLTTASHKLHPAVEQVSDMLQNKDFYGVEIRHPDDPLVQQAKDLAGYAASSFVPFSVRNVMQARKELQKPGQAAAGFFGLTPSPYYVGQSKAEQIASDIGARGSPQGPRTREAYEKSQQSRLLRNQLNTGQLSRANIMQKVGKGELPRLTAQNIIRQAGEKPLVRQMKSMQIEDALRVYEAGTPQEKKTLKLPLILKLRNAIRNGTPKQKVAYARRLGQIARGEAKTPVQPTPQDLGASLYQ